MGAHEAHGNHRGTGLVLHMPNGYSDRNTHTESNEL